MKPRLAPQFKHLLCVSIAAVGLLVLGATPARAASILPSFVGITAVIDPLCSGGCFKFEYDINLTSEEHMKSSVGSDFFTIYDFLGYVGGSASASGGDTTFDEFSTVAVETTAITGVGFSAHFTFSTALVGVTPAGTVPADDPTIPNLTWTYDGELSGDSTLDSPKGGAYLGRFSAYSLFGGTTTDSFTSQANLNSDGSVAAILATTTVPVPEPGSMLLFGSGLVGLAYAIRRRRAQAE